MITTTKVLDAFLRICIRRSSSSSQLRGSVATLTMATNGGQNDELDALFKQKRLLRTQVRKTLKAMDPSLRSQQGNDSVIHNRVTCS